MSGRGRRDQSRTSAPEAPSERDVEHTLRSEDDSMNESTPSRTIEDRRPRWRYLDDGLGYTDSYSSYPLDMGVSRRVEGHDRTHSKLEVKTYDGTCNPEAAYLWLDRVSFLAIIW